MVRAYVHILNTASSANGHSHSKNGSIQVAGREFDQGTSVLSIVGGTGKYSGISGEMESINNNNGTFTQTLRYLTKR